jgi:putative flavoprotein involved in K+ transport
LPDGAVLVVGAGSSGTQIANELLRAGRRVYLSIGPHVRLPRRYRDRDYCWWLGVLGEWDLVTPPQGAEHVTIPVSGAYGGETIDFRKLAAEGMTLVGMTQAFKNATMHFAPDLAANIARGDASYLDMLDRADACAVRNGLRLPEEPEARQMRSDPACLTDPILALDLSKAGVTSIIWATGYAVDYSWLPATALDDQGRPKHTRGISAEPGIYFLGLPWLSRRGSSFIWGVWHDAKYIADQISIQRGYLAYSPSRP